MTPCFTTSDYELTPHSVLFQIPVVNLLYDTFFDVPPTPDQLRDLLNLFGLMTALLLSVMMVLPFNFDHDTYMANIDRVNHIPYEEHDNVRGECEPDGGFVPPYESGCNRGYTEYKNFANRWSYSPS